MRVAIRHAAAIVLRRAQKIDLPQLITSKFLQVIASHINIYVKAREKCEWVEGGGRGGGGGGRGGREGLHMHVHVVHMCHTCMYITHMCHTCMYVHVLTSAVHAVPANAPVADIEAAVMQAYGDHTHIAMRGPTGNVRYFRRVARTLLPLLLPEDMLQSRSCCCCCC